MRRNNHSSWTATTLSHSKGPKLRWGVTSRHILKGHFCLYWIVGRKVVDRKQGERDGCDMQQRSNQVVRYSFILGGHKPKRWWTAIIVCCMTEQPCMTARDFHWASDVSSCESASCDVDASTFPSIINQSLGHLCCRCYITKATSQLKRNMERLLEDVGCSSALLLWGTGVSDL